LALTSPSGRISSADVMTQMGRMSVARVWKKHRADLPPRFLPMTRWMPPGSLRNRWNHFFEQPVLIGPSDPVSRNRFSNYGTQCHAPPGIEGLLLDHGHVTVVTQDALAGELCVSYLADELLIHFLQPLEEEGFLEVPGFVFKLEPFGLDRGFFLFRIPVLTFEFIVAHFHASGCNAQDGVLAAAELFEECCSVLVGAVVDAHGADLA
jgi:hypothetical protein